MAAKSDSTGSGSDPAAEVLVDEAANAAQGYRTAGKVVTAFLAAAPLATVITGLLKLPEGSEWNTDTLRLAGFLIVLSVIAGLLVSVSLTAPVELSDADPRVAGFNMARVPAVRLSSFGDLREQHLNLLARSPRSADEESDLKLHEAAIRDVYRLATADELRNRVYAIWPTWLGTLIAIVAGVAAVMALLLAPTPKEETVPTKVVSVTLTDTAMAKFGCETTSFKALRIGGTSAKPQVVPLGAECDARVLVLTVKGKAPTATDVTDVTPAEG